MYYRYVNGIRYRSLTSGSVIETLEWARKNSTRVHISYGDKDTGRDWLEENDVKGYIAWSRGSVKVPLLLPTRRSKGGLNILDHCIVRIRTSPGGSILYQHPFYNYGDLEIRPMSDPLVLDGRTLRVEVTCDGKFHVAFEDIHKAVRWAKKLGVRAPLASTKV